jgi:hypothetical protein
VIVLVPPLVGVKTPEDVIVPLLAVQLTVELKPPVPLMVAEQVDEAPLANRRDAGEQVTVTDVMVGGGFTVNVAVPNLVESCVLVAVIVALPEAGTEEGAVYKPELVIVPESADHVIAELYAPVPDTVAVHWLVWPVWTLVGAQDTLTDVMVGDTGVVLLPPPPPQPAMRDDRTAIKANRTNRLDVLPKLQLRTKPTIPASVRAVLARQVS